MKRRALLASATMIGILAAGPAAAKGYLYVIASVPNSALTTIFDINDKGVATGSWYDFEQVEHSYFGSPDGNYQTFDDPTDPGTEARGIDDGGNIVGFDNSQSGSNESYIPFERAANGTIANVTKGGATLNSLVQGINRRGVFVGSYINTNLQTVGYIGRNAKYTGAVNLKGIKNTGVAARGIDAAGDIVGWYTDPHGVQHGFYLTHGGTPQTIDSNAKNAASTVLEGLNDKGAATGQYTDTSGVIHGFIYNIAAKTFQEIHVKGAPSFVQAWGINNKGWVAVGSDAGYYVYCPSVRNCIGGAAAGHRPSTQRLRPQLP